MFHTAVGANIHYLFMTLANDERVVDLLPVFPTVAVRRGGGRNVNVEKTSGAFAEAHHSPKGYRRGRTAIS